MKEHYRIQRLDAGKWRTLALNDITICTDSEAKAFVKFCETQDIETEFRAQIKTVEGWITLQN